MCGIFGAITNKGLPGGEVGAVKNILRHRGPDDSGNKRIDLSGNRVLDLIHLRLSIIDLSGNAHQPMTDEDNNYTIIYNGEIYNFKEIKNELTSLGCKFFSNSDTEVVLKAYIEWGKECLDRFRGMFSFAIFDKRSEALFIARDHFGIKPLYYFFDGENFIFSSELKPLLLFKFVDKRLNNAALVSYMNYLWPDTDESIFKNIHKLPKASFLIVDRDFRVKINTYWKLNGASHLESEKEAISQLNECFSDSVKYHMIADVEVSSFLSGGLDSSLISVLAKRINKNLSTYTIAFSDTDKHIEKMPDDSFYAVYLANKEKLNHNEIRISPSMVDILDKVTYCLEEPIADPAAINTYLICKQAKARGVKVLLSGMGADEIFGGYRRHYAMILAQRYKKVPHLFKLFARNFVNAWPVRMGNSGIRQIRWLKRFFSFADLNIADAYLRSYSYYDKDELKKLMRFNFNNEIDEIYKRHSEIFHQRPEMDNINKMCWTDLNMFMVYLNLTYTDRASMANSVEVRVPFIDKKVVQLAMSLPGSLKIKGNQQKYILKKVSEKYLPKKIIYRPKASFGVPLRSWIHRDLREKVDTLIHEDNPLKKILDIGMVKNMIEKDRRGIEDYSYNIYQLLVLREWFSIFLN